MTPETLCDRLDQKFFSDHHHFQIIYDQSGILKQYFQNSKSKNEEMRILFVESSPHPSEFIDREQIVNDFNGEMGWYQHKWIIYVYGSYIEEVEKYESFQFYSRIGITFKFKSFVDFLLDNKIGIITRSSAMLLPSGNDYVDQMLFKTLSNIPLTCFITESQEFLESAGWMALLSELDALINSPEQFPSILKDCTDNEEQIDLTILICELLRFNPTDFEQIPKSFPKELISAIFGYISKILFNYDDEKIPQNHARILENIVQFILKPTAEKSGKKGTLDDLVQKSKKGEISEQFRKIKTQVLNKWVKSTDDRLRDQFRYWANENRKSFSQGQAEGIDIKLLEKQESYSGLADIILGNWLIETQMKDRASISEWEKKVTDIRKTRENFWNKKAQLWWKENSLFCHDTKSLSLEGFWKLIESFGCIFTQKLSAEGEWNDIQETAWEIERQYNQIKFLPVQIILAGENAAAAILDAFNRITDEYEKYIEDANQKFVQYYLTSLQNKVEKFHPAVASGLLDNAINDLTSDIHIAFIFCDALRKDIVKEVLVQLEEWFKKDKKMFKSHEIDEKDSLSLLPSDTAIGWPSALSKGDKLKYQLKEIEKEEFDIVLKLLLENGELLDLNSAPIREKRLKNVMQNPEKTISIQSYKEDEIKTLKSINSALAGKKTEMLIPVVWYDEIDIHDRNREEYLTKKDTFVNKLTNMIKNLHSIGIKSVYVFPDHGFIFAKDSDVLKKEAKPSGSIYKRYAISRQPFSSSDEASYPQWHIVHPESFGIETADQKKATLLFPKDLKIFKKVGGEDIFTHGGLSFFESDLAFFISRCDIIPEVTPVIEITNQKLADPETYILNSAGTNQKSIELILKAEKKENAQSSDIRRPIQVSVRCNPSNIIVEPNKEFKVSENSEQKITLYVPVSSIPEKIIFEIVEAGDIRARKEIKVQNTIIDTPLF